MAKTSKTVARWKYTPTPKGYVGPVQGQRANGTLWPTVHSLLKGGRTECGMALGMRQPTAACKRLQTSVVPTDAPVTCGTCKSRA